MFYQRRHIFSFIKVSSICIDFCEKYIQRPNFSIFIANETIKTLFTKGNLIRYYYFLNIYICYLNRSFMLVKFLFFDFNMTKFYNCFFHFYICFQKILYFFYVIMFQFFRSNQHFSTSLWSHFC